MTEAQRFTLTGFVFLVGFACYFAWAVWQFMDCVRTGEIFHAKAFAASAGLAFVMALIVGWTLANP